MLLLGDLFWVKRKCSHTFWYMSFYKQVLPSKIIKTRLQIEQLMVMLRNQNIPKSRALGFNTFWVKGKWSTLYHAGQYWNYCSLGTILLKRTDNCILKLPFHMMLDTMRFDKTYFKHDCDNLRVSCIFW
jgi:hypothetical protein